MKPLNNIYKQDNVEELICIDDLCQILKVKKAYIYNLTHTNQIPYYKLGNLLRFKLSDIETINSKTGKPKINIYSSKLDLKIKKILNKDDYTINVSMSHEKEYSIAQVIIY